MTRGGGKGEGGGDGDGGDGGDGDDSVLDPVVDPPASSNEGRLTSFSAATSSRHATTGRFFNKSEAGMENTNNHKASQRRASLQRSGEVVVKNAPSTRASTKFPSPEPAIAIPVARPFFLSNQGWITAAA